MILTTAAEVRAHELLALVQSDPVLFAAGRSRLAMIAAEDRVWARQRGGRSNRIANQARLQLVRRNAALRSELRAS